MRFLAVFGSFGAGGDLLREGEGLVRFSVASQPTPLVVWWMDRCSFLAAHRRGSSVHGQRNLRCVPNQCATLESFFCGSLQSLCVMRFLLAWVVFPSCLFSSDGFSDGRGRVLWAVSLESIEDPDKLVVIFLFRRIVCALGWDSCSIPYHSSGFLYLYCYFVRLP